MSYLSYDIEILYDWRDEVLANGDRPKAVRIQRLINKCNYLMGQSLKLQLKNLSARTRTTGL